MTSESALRLPSSDFATLALRLLEAFATKAAAPAPVPAELDFTHHPGDRPSESACRSHVSGSGGEQVSGPRSWSITARAASKLFGLSHVTVSRWIKHGVSGMKLASQKIGSRWCILVGDLKRFIRACAGQPVDPMPEPQRA
jgi:Helix-turn-helix domain